ncbi:hypothetical protein ACFL5Z_06745 [Planctomycetota bacterium]
MTRTATSTAVKRIITKGLTGWEAGKLILQDSIDSYFHRDSVLTEADHEAIQHKPMEGADVQDYNMFMALCRGFHLTYMLGEWTRADASLQIYSLERMLSNVDKRRTVELFESFGPRVVTRKQYEDIVVVQKQKKLEFEYILSYVVEERFYAKAPPEAREEIDEICPDIESAEDFASAVPKNNKAIFKQAIEEIRLLHTSGKLLVIPCKENTKEAEPLLAKWNQGQLSELDTLRLVDMLFVSGQELYNCEELPEWKDYMDSYSRFMFTDEDERFWHTYAILDDCPLFWLDKNGYYKGSEKTSEWITRSTELHLDMIHHNGKPKKSIQSVGEQLTDRLETAMLDIRLFFAVKTILDVAAEVVGLDIPNKGGMLAFAYMRLGAFISLYNIRLEELNKDKKSRKSDDSRLEKALKMLPAIDTEKLKPSSDSLKKLKAEVLKDAQGYNWLRTTVLSLEYDDGFSFKELFGNG